MINLYQNVSRFSGLLVLDFFINKTDKFLLHLIRRYQQFFEANRRIRAFYKDGELSFSYTWNDTKDNTSYNGNVANSATLSQMVVDDPRDLSKMTYSNNQFRHKLVVYGSAPTFWGITVGARFSGIGGTRYSMIVNGNVNGDFVDSNDLAYVYDPNSSATPDYIREGINSILNNPDAEKSVKDYIRKSFGKVAKRRSKVP